VNADGLIAVVERKAQGQSIGAEDVVEVQVRSVPHFYVCIYYVLPHFICCVLMKLVSLALPTRIILIVPFFQQIILFSHLIFNSLVVCKQREVQKQKQQERAQKDVQRVLQTASESENKLDVALKVCAS
jgi:hypothetical protein